MPVAEIRKGLIKRIHINKHVIACNLKNNENEPPITVQTSRGPRRAQAVRIDGPSILIHSPDTPLKCGARVWLETKSRVELIT